MSFTPTSEPRPKSPPLASSAARVAEPSSKLATRRKVKILLVDDRPDKLLALEVMLRDLQEEIIVATSGRQALRCLLQDDYAVILLDVNMPGMDGFETAALIRQRQRSEDTPIIFFSAVNDTENHVSRGYSLGAVDYILSPVVPEILRAKVAVFVDLFRKSEQIRQQAEERAEFIREQGARAEAEAAQKRMEFLADASKVLSGTLDRQEIFQRLAELLVPKIADSCAVDIADRDQTLRQVAVAHRINSENFPAPRSALIQDSDANPNPVPRTIQLSFQEKSCHLQLVVPDDLRERFSVSVATPAMHHLDDADDSDDGLHEVLKNEFTGTGAQEASGIVVPILGRERSLGVLSLLRHAADVPFGSADLHLAEALAQRAALALENASLYAAAQRARLEAERANLAKDQFLAMLSHELRTPLTPVLTSVLNLEGTSDLPTTVRDALEMIRRNVELEARLIDDLLDLTRTSKGKVQLSLEKIDAHAVLQSAWEICATEIGEKKLAVLTDFSAAHVNLEADPARLQQIFWNLIKNAVKFTPAGGQLMLRTKNAGDRQLCVEISDSGVGIAAELLPRIFDAFEQGQRSGTSGLGLGLAITKKLVDLHGGQIAATSAGVNQGATFTLHFATVEDSREISPRVEQALPKPRKSLRVLLVEDHADSNHSLTQLLRRRGYEVRSAFDVKTAVEMAVDFSPEVLVSDMGLPDGSGLDVIERLTSRAPLYAIALSGFGMESDLARSHQAGFRHHLIKPVDLNRLDDLIQQAARMEQSPQMAERSSGSVD